MKKKRCKYFTLNQFCIDTINALFNFYLCLLSYSLMITDY